MAASAKRVSNPPPRGIKERGHSCPHQPKPQRIRPKPLSPSRPPQIGKSSPPQLTTGIRKALVLPVDVIPPSTKLSAINKALSSKPLKPLFVEKMRAQVIEHLSESKSEMLKSGHGAKGTDPRVRDRLPKSRL